MTLAGPGGMEIDRSDTEVVREGCGRGDNWLGRAFQLPCAYLDVQIIADDGDGVEDDWGWFLVMMMTMVEMMVVIDLAGVLGTLPI